MESSRVYRAGAAMLRSCMNKPIPDDAVRVAALQNGEIDVAVNTPPHPATVIANHPKLFLSTAASVRPMQLLYHTPQHHTPPNTVVPAPTPTPDRRIPPAHHQP